MAAKEPETEITVERIVCGYCLEEEIRLDDPKVLPCSHVFCSPCLNSHMDTSKILKCGECRTAYDTTVADLPSLNTVSIHCQSCRRRGHIVDAVVYCHDCASQFCAKHEETHEDMFDHSTIDIAVYSQKAKKLQTRYCKTHSTHPISLGCEVCSRVLCTNCLDSKDGCRENDSHHPVSLTRLATKMKEELILLKLKAQEKEGQLSAILKQCSGSVADLDEETEKLMKMLRDTRDEQIKTLRTKYSELEKEIVMLRQRSRGLLVDFMDTNLAVKLNDLSAEMKRVDVSIRDHHEVDFINRFSYSEKLLRKLINEKLPWFVNESMSTLNANGECRDIELKITQSNKSLSIGDQVMLEAPSSTTITDDLGEGTFCDLSQEGNMGITSESEQALFSPKVAQYATAGDATDGGYAGDSTGNKYYDSDAESSVCCKDAGTTAADGYWEYDRDGGDDRTSCMIRSDASEGTFICSADL